MKFEVETCISRIYNKPTIQQTKISNEQRLNQELCDNCNRRFEDSGHGTKYNEKKNDIYTGRLICHKCYTKIQNDKPDSHNNRRKEHNRLIGHSRKRTDTICISCGTELDNNPHGHPLRQYENEVWTGKWICPLCYYDIDYKHRLNNKANIIKLLRDRRIDNLKWNTNLKGDIFEELTCKWRGVKSLNIENDNYLSPIDHTPDKELGIIQTKGRLETNEPCWTFSTEDSNKDFNYMICYCADRKMDHILRIYIFPKHEVIESKRNNIKVMKNPTRRKSWVEKYRVTDKETLEKVDNIFQEIMKDYKELKESSEGI